MRHLYSEARPPTKVDEVFDSLSLEEKIAQMAQIEINLLGPSSDLQSPLNQSLCDYYIGEKAVGSVLNTVSVPWTAEMYRKASMQIQQAADKYNRPPVIWGLDSVHGANYVYGATLTPQPINIAASFNTTVAQLAGQIASRDTRAAGINWLFSPLLGIAVEPKWSRVYETFGEDPLVVGDMAAAMIFGIQLPDEDRDAFPRQAAACAKHFIGYTAPLHGHDRAPSWIPTRHLYNLFLFPWKRAMRQNVLTVMESYTETDGVPNVANHEALDYLLRQRLGFDGVLVTDYAEIYNLAEWHHTVPDKASAVETALTNGSVDVSMIPWDLDGFLGSALSTVKGDHVSVDKIDESARRVLLLKDRLDMFSQKITMEDPNLARVGTDRREALEMAQQAIVLAKNEDSTLPLSGHHKVLVTGPTANSVSLQSGGWSWQWQGVDDVTDWCTYGSTVLEALTRRKGPGYEFTVTFSCGISINGGECSDEDAAQGMIEKVDIPVGTGGTSASIDRAVKAAQRVDTILVCIGEDHYAEKPGDINSSFLPEGQVELVRRLKAETGKKIVLVYFGGRPRFLSDMVDYTDSVLVAFLPGPDGGEAVARIVSGEYNPSARMPLTYPAFEDNTGVPYYREVSDRCNWQEGLEDPFCVVQWPFGHGLSFTSFSYSSFKAFGGIDDDLRLSVTVMNTGDVAGAETVIFFTFDIFRQTTPEYKRLRAFEKVFLEPGESTVVSAIVPVDDLKFIGAEDDRHFVLDRSMKGFAGVGASTDCRVHPEDALCVELKSSQEGISPYIPACITACEVWRSSGCYVSYFGSDEQACYRSCVESSDVSARNGWGWNYVDCLEEVNWKHHQSDQSCLMMRSLCRDVLQTRDNSIGSVPTANFVALIAGLIATAFIIKNFRRDKKEGRDSEEHVQFTPVVTAEVA